MKIFWFDCKTTGADPNKHGIVSLTSMGEIDERVVNDGVLYNNPLSEELTPAVQRIDRFTHEEMATFPLPRVTHERLTRLFGWYASRFERSDEFFAAGYNVEFDMRFLRKLWEEQGDPYFSSWFAYPVLDPPHLVVPMRCAGLLDRLPISFTLAEYLEVPLAERHDPLDDLRATRHITRKPIEIMRAPR